jgi:hypothetical protein
LGFPDAYWVGWKIALPGAVNELQRVEAAVLVVSIRA